MERKIYLIVLFFLLSTAAIHSTNTAERLIYRAYIGNDMGLWKRTMIKLHRMPVMSSAQMLELVNYLYGYTAWTINEGNSNEARRFIQIAESYLDTLEYRKFRPADLLAYRSALIGFKINMSPLSAPVLGPRSFRYAREALQTNPQSYMAHMQMGHIYFYAPSAFGGDKDEAIRRYLRALQLYKLQNKNRTEDWNYLSLLINIGQAYAKTGQPDSARRYYLRALKVAPNLTWVRNELLPELDKHVTN
jgi:tetratricopeptide (TPR) repeat protein